jgi:Flp pilus assembly protein CpaB
MTSFDKLRMMRDKLRMMRDQLRMKMNFNRTRVAIAVAVAAGALTVVFLVAVAGRPRPSAVVSSEQDLAHRIPAGMRAASVSVNSVTGVAGAIKKDDKVDVLATFDLGNDAASKAYTYTILEGVSVLSVSEEAGGLKGLGASSAKRTVTLSVRPADAQKLVLAQESGGISLLLRPSAEPDVQLVLPPATPASVTGDSNLVWHSKRPVFREYRGK